MKRIAADTPRKPKAVDTPPPEPENQIPDKADMDLLKLTLLQPNDSKEALTKT